jgi:hypothetical protein
MATIVGGLRVRLVFDSLKNDIETALTALGWFDSGRSHEDLIFLTGPVDGQNAEEPIRFNTLVLNAEDLTDFPLEMGSHYAEHRRVYYLTLYAESKSVGDHLAADLRDYLQGRMPSIGVGETFQVYDYTQATPPVISVAEIEGVLMDGPPQTISYPWQRFMYDIAFDVLDSYGTDAD